LLLFSNRGYLEKQMTVVHIHDRPKQDQRAVTPWSAWFFNRPGPANMKFWLTGIAFLALYLAFNELKEPFEFSGLGITVWSPDNGLALVMITEGAMFAPFVFLSAVLADTFILGVHHSLYVTVTAELVLTVCYMGLAAVLRHKLKFNLRQVRLADVVALLFFLPAGAALTSVSYCGVLYLGGTLPADQFFVAMRHFWIGDTLGMITIIPAATSLFAFLSMPTWGWSGYTFVSYLVFMLGTCLALAALIGGGETKQYHIFYPLFLPIIWIGVREGYAGVAVALLVVQLGLVAATTYIGSDINDFYVFQTLMLVLSITGLLLGAVTSERRIATQLLCEQQIELARMSASVKAGAMGMAFAHELSQPLSTVAAYLHAARRLLQSGATSERLMDTLNMAEAEAQRTREVMERIRESVSNGKLDLQMLDLPALVRKIATLCREEAMIRGIQVEIEGIRPAPPIRADRLQIEQVLNNLVVNAIDAASERLDARGRVIIGVAARGDRVVVQVEDNGPGVAPEIANRMFEAYQSTKPRGMGLGLYLSQQIVQKHAGRLWWEPDVPEGTRFVVELPINGPDQNAA
jgi:two-component system, LuxR family, sensor kinase FixL